MPIMSITCKEGQYDSNIMSITCKEGQYDATNYHVNKDNLMPMSCQLHVKKTI